ncbi:MAG: hypothetical protein ABH821_03195 [archaeon]
MSPKKPEFNRRAGRAVARDRKFLINSLSIKETILKTLLSTDPNSPKIKTLIKEIDELKRKL